MSDVEMVVVANGRDSRIQPLVASPGERLAGELILTPPEAVNTRSIAIALSWHTEGRGTRFEATVTESVIHQGELRARLPTTFPFAFEVPNEPWSYAGHYVSIVWEIVVHFDLPVRRDRRLRLPLVVHPRPAADSAG